MTKEEITKEFNFICNFILQNREYMSDGIETEIIDLLKQLYKKLTNYGKRQAYMEKEVK